MSTDHIVRVADARLYYEVRGSGPFLLLTGSPMAAPAFAPMADELADSYTVITHDPRGIGRSGLDDPEQDSTPELRADDIVAILDDLGAESADVFGSSGGAVSGLALVTRHPSRVRTLVAHEPPVIELLPDAAEQHAATDEIIATYHREGVLAAWMKFMGNAGFDEENEGPPPGESTEQDLADSARFFAHELRGTTRFVPDIAALGAARVLLGVGVDSKELVTYRTSAALAEALGSALVEFPGDHGGFVGLPAECAAVLRKVLGS